MVTLRHSHRRMSSLQGSALSSRSVPVTGMLSLCDYFDTVSQTAKDASSIRDKLIEIFNRIERFFHRLEIYIDITPTAAMRDIIVEIMVEVVTILGIATKEVKRGRMSELLLHGFTILD